MEKQSTGDMITFATACSGIEAPSIAMPEWWPKWFSEIEPFPCELLAHRYPGTPNLGDMTGIAKLVRAGEVAAPDVFIGGTPCQAFSVAGLRNGLSDERGALTISFVEIADAIDDVRLANGKPESVIWWENVPGVLTSKDNAFGCFLGALAGESCELQPPGRRWENAGCVYGPKRAIAWRVLDAQHFGLAQRRKRVFVVASARKGFNPAAVLFEFDGVRRDSAPSREKGESPARNASSCSTEESWGAGPGYRCPCGYEFGEHLGAFGCANCEGDSGPAELLGAAKGFRLVSFGEYADDETASTMKARDHKDATDLVTVSVHGAQDPIVGIERAHALGRNNGAENAVYCGTQNDALRDLGREIAPTLRAGSNGGAVNPVVGPICWSEELNSLHELSGALARGGDGGRHAGVMDRRGVRRLTPVECERLQGFPEIKKSIIINVTNNEIESVCYLDLQKTNADAETRCLRSQSNALNAEEEESKHHARNVEQNSSATQAESKKHAQVTVLIDLERETLQILNQKKSVLSVKTAGKQNLCPLHIQLEDFAQLSVAMLSELEKKAQPGKEGEHQSIRGFIPQQSGRRLAGGFGLETEGYAKDVEKLTKEVKNYMKSTTSGVGSNSQNSEQKLAILFYCVTSVINLYIQEKTNLGSSYALKVETTIGYTKIPWRNKPADECPDGHRYKALGNSMAVPVMRWIGQRIQGALND